MPSAINSETPFPLEKNCFNSRILNGNAISAVRDGIIYEKEEKCMKYLGRVIDSHIHIHGGFEDLDGFLTGMEKLRNRSGVDAVAIASIPMCDTECVGQNVISLMQKASYPDTTFVLAGFDYHMPTGVAREDFLSQARRFMEMGCDGIKMLEGKPNVRKLLGGICLDSPLYDAFYAYMEKQQIPLLLHAADPASFWDDRTLPSFARNSGWGYTDSTFAAKEQICAETEDVLERFPGMKVVLAHFYFLSGDIERAARLLDKFPNMSYDITPGTEMFADFSARADEWRDFFTRYSRRILFGTDNGCGTFIPMEQKIERATNFVTSMRHFLETSDEFYAFTGFDMPVRGLNLDINELKNIYAYNFCRFISEQPRKLDIGSVVSYAEKMVWVFNGANLPQYELSCPQMQECLARFRKLVK